METGKYSRRSVDFSKYKVQKFIPHLFYSEGYTSGCGGNALSLLTGIAPSKIPVVKKDHYSDRFMISFLRNHKIKCIKLTKCNLTNKTSLWDINYSIGNDNVLLISQLVGKGIGSWFVVWDGISYHNFNLAKFSGMDCINFPISSAYVLFNTSWLINNKI